MPPLVSFPATVCCFHLKMTHLWMGCGERLTIKEAVEVPLVGVLTIANTMTRKLYRHAVQRSMSIRREKMRILLGHLELYVSKHLNRQKKNCCSTAAVLLTTLKVLEISSIDRKIHGP